MLNPTFFRVLSNLSRILVSHKQRHMFKCGHDCLDDKNTTKQAERCIDDCGQTMHQAMNILQNEATAFQVRHHA